MAEQRDLLVRINGDTSGLNRAMGDAQKSTDSADKGFSNFKESATKVAQVLQATGVALTAYAVGATNFTIDYVRDARTLARTTGETVTEASRLSFAFKRLGLDSGDATATLNTFSKKIQGAKDDANDANNAFQRLNVPIKNTDGTLRGMSAVLFDVADRFQKMPDGIEKNATALELFGRSGTTLIPLLNKGSTGIKELEAQADKLGLTLTDKTITSVAKYIESTKKLKEQQDALKVAVGTLTTPVMAAFNQKMLEASNVLIGADSPFRTTTANVLAFGGPIATAAGGLIGLAGSAGSAVPLLSALGVSLAGVSAALGTFLIVAGIASAAVFAVVQAFGGWDNTLKVLKETYDKNLRPSLEGLWNQITNQLLPALRELWVAVEPILMPALRAMGFLLAGTLLVAIYTFINALRAITLVLTEISRVATWWINEMRDRFNFVVELFRTLAPLISSAIGNVKDAITKPFREAFSWIQDNVGKTKESLGRLSPWKRESPSLVDYVKSGTSVIEQEYAGMFNAIRGQADGYNKNDLASAMPATGVGNGVQPAPTASSAPQVFSPKITVNLGMYAGMPVEKREIAVELWREIVREARSQGVQLPQIGIQVQ